MTQITEAIFTAGIVVLAILVGNEDPIKKVYRVPMCIEGQTQDVWSDFVERELSRYPDAHCGGCGKPTACPKQ